MHWNGRLEAAPQRDKTSQVVLRLSFDEQVDSAAKARISYAFAVFCAVYGYAVAADGERENAASLQVRYGGRHDGGQGMAVPASYVARPPDRHAPPPRYGALPPRKVYRRIAAERFPHFTPDSSAGADWLGELFEWLSGADEYAVTERDEVGRVPYRCTLHGRFTLDPCVPYAAIAMYEFNARLRGTFHWLPESPRGWNGTNHTLIAASHDLDFIPLSPVDSARRLVKNIVKAAIASHDPKLAAGIARSAVVGVGRMRSPLNYIPMLRSLERSARIDSTFNVLCERRHSRDANYILSDSRVLRLLRELNSSGAEIAVHGSYTSLDSPTGLSDEFQALRAQGFHPVGVRQHWLRHSGSRLYDKLERIGVLYDSTAGYSERAGFRNGACFPYPPYCFSEERAYAFLEIPLAIMDGSLYAQDRSTHSHRAICERILDAVRTFGSGGVSVLWHNTAFEGGQLPKSIGNLYWQLKREGDKWTTAADLASCVFDRYASAGLLRTGADAKRGMAASQGA